MGDATEKLRHEIDIKLDQMPTLLSGGADTRLSVKPKLSLWSPLMNLVNLFQKYDF